MSAYAKRALTHCSSWDKVHAEFDRIRQLLTNNGYNDNMIEEIIGKALSKYMNKEEDDVSNNDEIIIYHHLTYGTHYKQECDAARKIVERGVSPMHPYNRII